MNDLDRAREMLAGLGDKFDVLGRLARGELSSADLPALRRAAADLGEPVIAEALRRLEAGHAPTSILTFLVASGDFPGLVERLSALRETVDAAAVVARALRGGGRR